MVLFRLKKLLITAKNNNIPAMTFKSTYWKLVKVTTRIPKSVRVQRAYMMTVKILFTLIPYFS